MKRMSMLLIALCMAMLMAGCLGSDLTLSEDDQTDGDTSDGDTPDGDTPDPEIGPFNSSGCKEDVPTPMYRDVAGESDAPSVIFNPIEAIASGNSVEILHNDAYYQCGADIAFTMDVDGNDLVLTENDRGDMVADCMCYMDLSVEIHNLASGETYHIEVWNEDHRILFGEVDVTIGDEPVECMTDSDCYGFDLDPYECQGFHWQCRDNACIGVCGPEDRACTSNADCPSGYHCEFYDYPMPGEPDGGGELPPDNEAAEDLDDDTLEPGMPSIECMSDADCPEGMACELMEYDCPEGADCMPSPYGICMDLRPPEPVEGVCVANSGDLCEDLGGFCNAMTPDGFDCPPGTEAAMEWMYDEPLCGMGAVCCVPMEPECYTDEDCYGMEPGYDEGGSDEAPYPPGRFACVDNQCVYIDQCYSDQDCPRGQSCIDGMCRNDCVCPEYYSPVCGADGVTYANECFAECEGQEILYYGECEECPPIPDIACPPNMYLECYIGEDGCEYCECVEVDPCFCDDNWDPVCGSNHQTYSNRCYAECEGVRVMHMGECEECYDDSDCPRGFFCNTCPPDPNCPLCAVCGPAVCEPMDEPATDCEEMGGFCMGLYPGAVCPMGYEAVYTNDVSLCGDGAMCCVGILDGHE